MNIFNLAAIIILNKLRAIINMFILAHYNNTAKFYSTSLCLDFIVNSWKVSFKFPYYSVVRLKRCCSNAITTSKERCRNVVRTTCVGLFMHENQRKAKKDHVTLGLAELLRLNK